VNISAYGWLKRDNSTTNTTDSKGKADKVATIGSLISTTPIENLTASLEGAYQFGKMDNSSYGNSNRHEAWALQAMADYTFANVKMTPQIGASYTYLSGGENTSRNGGWDSMFYDQALNNITYAILPFTNMNVFNLKASAKPVEDVTLSLNYGYYNLAKAEAGATITSPSAYDGSSSHPYLSATTTGKSHLGDAIDITAVYDYTEDVQFGLTGGWFRPGDAFATEKRDATQLIGSMKVTF
jgi:hypothetical protein